MANDETVRAETVDENEAAKQAELQKQIEQIQVANPAIIIGYNKFGALAVNVNQGTSASDAIAMMLKLVNQMAAQTAFQMKKANLVEQADPSALKVLDGLKDRAGFNGQ